MSDLNPAATSFVSAEDQSVTWCLDASTYSEETVVKAAYWSTGECGCTVEQAAEPGHIRVVLRALRPDVDLQAVSSRFLNELLHQRLQRIIDKETSLLREIIVSGAFNELDQQYERAIDALERNSSSSPESR